MVTVVKEWDGNERIHEASNGRVYVSQGRWQWLVTVDGQVQSVHETAREAKAAAAKEAK